MTGHAHHSLKSLQGSSSSSSSTSTADGTSQSHQHMQSSTHADAHRNCLFII
jgi:hypothetical protein